MNNHKSAVSAIPSPTGKVQIRMYDVGFGDCFLLSFGYSDDKNRHILIDCGTVSEKKDRIDKVVEQIKKDCGGHLHGLVVTHRHKDHLSAFGLKDAGGELEKLQPEVVIQPWTEHPDAQADAETVPDSNTQSMAFDMWNIYKAQGFMEYIVKDLSVSLPGSSKAMQKQVNNIKSIADININNQKAVERLMQMGQKSKAVYVYTGSRSGLEDILPGIDVMVLGPPTLEQSDAIKSHKTSNPSEYWSFHTNLMMTKLSNVDKKKGKSYLFPKAAKDSIKDTPSHIKWIINKIDYGHSYNTLRFVRTLDKVLNNTSVIFLFHVKDNFLLFPGDAQLENWQYVLNDKKYSALKAKLKKTTVYKAGHHGSGNATPKSLWNLFSKRNTNANSNRISVLLPTKKGEYNNVPRESLVKVFESETNLFSTEDCTGSGILYKDIDIQ